MIISNQIEHLRNLYNELNYDEVIQFAAITLQMAFETKRYEEALSCYEYLASALIEVGNYEDFSHVMKDYENLCLTYGEDNNKMNFYYLLSLSNTMLMNYEEAILAAKKSIQYAHYLNDDELVVINYANMAAQYLLLGHVEKAQMVIELSNYYKNKLPEHRKPLVRANVGALYYYAGIGNERKFLQVKENYFQNIDESHVFYRANISIVEGVLMFRMNEIEASLGHFEFAFQEFTKQYNLVHLKIIENLILRFHLAEQCLFFDQLQFEIKHMEDVTIKMQEVQSIYKDLVFADEVHAATFKYPNVVSKDLIMQHVDEALEKEESLFCMHWCFITTEIEDLFGNLFVEQLLFTLFETTYHLIFEYDAEVNVRSENEGEAILKNISETDFFKLLMELEEKLQSVVVHSTMGRVEIPIHFGFIHSDQLSKEELSYEGLVAHADASLYYAKSHGQLYIYS